MATCSMSLWDFSPRLSARAALHLACLKNWNVRAISLKLDPLNEAHEKGRANAMAFLCSWRFRESALSVFSKDVAGLIARYVYDAEVFVPCAERGCRCKGCGFFEAKKGMCGKCEHKSHIQTCNSAFIVDKSFSWEESCDSVTQSLPQEE